MEKLVLAVAAVLLLAISVPSNADVMGTARLSLTEGDIAVQTEDAGEWSAASVNMPLLPGDRIWAGAGGRTEVQFIGGSYVRLDENTELDITRLKRDGEHITQIAIPEGRIYLRNRPAPSVQSVFQVDTPFMTVKVYGRAKCDIYVDEEGFSEVYAIEGMVYVEGEHGSTRLMRGDLLSLGVDGVAEVSSGGRTDAWGEWNRERDSRYVQPGESSRYLPLLLNTYSHDFDEHGDWIYAQDCGYVWRPRIAAAGWAPYSVGRWVWIRNDYVWISFESWGWVPYHYGRWAFRAGTGWFWVPPPPTAVVWAPGLVAWITAPTYVSWVPLAPGENYYGYGHYGPHSVNLHKVNIKNINITNVYINSKVVNGVTVINRETFLTGKSVTPMKKHINPFVAGVKALPGRPQIKPMKSTKIAHPDRHVSEMKLPARRIVEKVKRSDIRNRPIAEREDISVFKKGTKTSPMPVTRSARSFSAPKERTHRENGAETDKPVVNQKRRDGAETDKPVVNQIRRNGAETDKPVVNQIRRNGAETDRPIVNPKLEDGQILKRKETNHGRDGVPGAINSPLVSERQKSPAERSGKSYERPSGLKGNNGVSGLQRKGSEIQRHDSPTTSGVTIQGINVRDGAHDKTVSGSPKKVGRGNESVAPVSRQPGAVSNPGKRIVQPSESAIADTERRHAVVKDASKGSMNGNGRSVGSQSWKGTPAQ